MKFEMTLLQVKIENMCSLLMTPHEGAEKSFRFSEQSIMKCNTLAQLLSNVGCLRLANNAGMLHQISSIT